MGEEAGEAERLRGMMIGVIGRAAIRLRGARRRGDVGVRAMIVGVPVGVRRPGEGRGITRRLGGVVVEEEEVVGGDAVRAIRTRVRGAIAGIAAAAATAVGVDVEKKRNEWRKSKIV